MEQHPQVIPVHPKFLANDAFVVLLTRLAHENVPAKLRLDHEAVVVTPPRIRLPRLH